ncbi:MAG TPA: tRNA (guanosine(37)-N1)-methyltransferase TrmD [Luteibaculaceae bacterium]|nr:tRNA (guanosine(37)-N1)-methyltransferase TrmD [Luteibaculaceae bacterium]
MRIDIVTALPSLLESPFNDSIVQRAKNKEIVSINIHNLRDYSTNKHKTIDDYPFGGGAGMVLGIEPIARCFETLQAQCTYDDIIYMTPDGEVLDQRMANQLSLSGNLLILCGHYKGVDERVREHFITREVSIGSFVLSGGELAAAVLVDAVVRLIPGVLGDETSALTDSFQDNLLAPPIYTRPSEFNGWKVPEILLSGNERLIENWRHEKALERTRLRRPDLLDE